MHASRRTSTTGYPVSLLVIGLLAFFGCSAGETDGDDDHAGHVIPAHKPKSFPDAVRRLRELNNSIADKPPSGQPGSADDDQTLQVARDIANWLPEIAADSDMPEAPWNKVSTQSAIILADYEAMLTAKGANDTRELASAGKAISELESVLSAADLRWFAETDPRGGPP